MNKLRRRSLIKKDHAQSEPGLKSEELSSEAAKRSDRKLAFLGWFGLSMRLDSDFEPFGKRSPEDEYGPDCSCGCRYFIALAPSSLSADWGCCLNKKSPRAGLLTFEHMGCRQFEYGPPVAK
jgi:hypothetical protein